MPFRRKQIAVLVGGDKAGHRSAVASEAGPAADALLRALERPLPSTPAALKADLTRLFPLIVPSDYFNQGVPFPAPRFQLAEKSLSLTWVLLGLEGMLYLRPEESASFDAAGLGWQQRAIRNLLTAGPVATHQKDDDGRLLWLAAMQGDGLGSSRVLAASVWDEYFPEGYWLALPDRSCGMAISMGATKSELREIKALVAEMHADATTPMCDRLFKPEELALPPEWMPA